MKYVAFFLLACVAVASAAPQLITTGVTGLTGVTGITGITGLTGLTGWPGVVSTAGVVSTVGNPLGVNTLVAGPTVVNGAVPTTIGGRIVTSNGILGGSLIV